MEEAKKRGSAEEMGEETQSKKLQVRPMAPDSSLTTVQVGVEAVLDRSNNLHLKLLIPSIAAGAIIGKGGETIADIQKSVGRQTRTCTTVNLLNPLAWSEDQDEQGE